MINFTTKNSTTLGQFLILLTILISYYSTIVDAFAAPSTKLDPVTYLRTEWVSYCLHCKDMLLMCLIAKSAYSFLYIGFGSIMYKSNTS